MGTDFSSVKIVLMREGRDDDVAATAVDDAEAADKKRSEAAFWASSCCWCTAPRSKETGSVMRDSRASHHCFASDACASNDCQGPSAAL